MNFYKHSEWTRFRAEVIKIDGGKCVRCYRSRADGVVLQAHHKVYYPGRKPWEYEFIECETLCKGCHAEEHGITIPQSGWELVGSDDLGDLIGNCELCGTDLRYVYAIVHPKWDALAVGTDCCDRLTATSEASEFHDAMLKARDARARFVSSMRWKDHPKGGIAIVQKGINVRIIPSNAKFRISMNSITGKIEYDSMIDAKLKVYESIKSGEAVTFLAKRRRSAEREMGRLAHSPIYS
jgi:hypothetical protein